MSDKRFHVIFTGKLVPGADKATVTSNLVLDIGLSEEKARTLLTMDRVVLKRFPSALEAQRLAERFERAGAMCIIEDHAPDSREQPGSGESSLITTITRFKPVFRSQEPEPLPAESAS